MNDLNAQLLIAWLAYAVGTATPGPSNLAVMTTAIQSGRQAALALAGGVVAGSTTWGVVAAAGLGSAFNHFPSLFVLAKVIGAFYLLWLSYASAREAIAGPKERSVFQAGELTPARAFKRGFLLHLTNPKAVLVWSSIVVVALPDGAHRSQAFLLVASCALIGAVVFGAYALAFSTQSARRAYKSVHRFMHGLLAVVYAYAGVRLLMSKANMV